MQLSQAVENFVISREAEAMSVETVSWYRKRLGRMRKYFGDVDLAEITSDSLRRFIVSLQSVDLSPFTVEGYTRCFKTFFGWCEREGLCSNVARIVKKPKLPKPQPKEIAESDIFKMLAASQVWGKHQLRNYAMILFLAETACRVAGLARLRIRDLDLIRCQAVVTEKGKKSRVVFFGRRTRSALRAWLKVRGVLKHDFVFVGDRGPLTRDGVRMTLRHIKNYAQVVGRANPHAFRHAFVKRSLLGGADISMVSGMLGHTDIKTTSQAYAIYRSQELQQAHKKFSSLDAKLKKRKK